MPAQNKTSLGLNQWLGNEYPKRIDFVEDNQIINDELEKRVKYTDIATENKAGIITESRIKNIIPNATDTVAGILTLNKVREIAPQPDLSPYQTKTNFWKYSDSILKVVGTSNTGNTFAGKEIEMFDNLGAYQGSFHVNGNRAYYKVPNRAGGAWCVIMDNIDMKTRDDRIDDLQNARNTNTVCNLRLSSMISVGINSNTERNGYVITNVTRKYGSTLDGVSVNLRALQMYRNGGWVNVPFV